MSDGKDAPRSTDAPAPPLGVHHLAVKVRDLERAEAFYGGILGLAVTRRQDDERGRPRSIWFALPGTSFLAIERAERAEPTRFDDAPGWHCIALAIPFDAREAWRARLEAKGFPVEHETAYTLYVRDPEGALVALSHHPVSITGVSEPGSDPAAAPSGVTARLAALVTLSALLLAIAIAPVSAQRGRAIHEDVLLVGSSSVNGALGRVIESELERATGLSVRRIGHSSTGLSRPDFFDWNAEVRRLGDLHTTRGVIVYLGGNDTQAIYLMREDAPERPTDPWIRWSEESRWTPLYTRRVTTFVDGLCAAGAPRVVFVLPADGEREGWSERIHRVQEAQAAGVRASRCGSVVDPRGVAVERGTVDGVHLSRTGARAVWDRIGPMLTRAFTNAS
jgi:catechol 2,3-dioxygenase-like lactoylglutathione lyase family enzyme/lysophospholipase L1-like esterase